MISKEDSSSTEDDIWKDASKNTSGSDGKHKIGIGLYYQSQYKDNDIEITKSLDKKPKQDSNITDILVFRPNLYFPKLTIYNDCSFLDGAKLLVDRRLVFIVTAKYDTDWYRVKSGQMDGWIHISSQMINRKSIEFPNSIVRYELWQGNNYFFCGGRCMTSYDIPLFR